MNKKDKFLQNSSILFILNISASALNYLCQLIMARVLSVESYGTVNTIFSFMMIIAVPGTTLTMVVAKYYAGNEHQKWAYLIQQLKVVCGLTVSVFLILLLIQRYIKQILDINDEIVLMFAFILAALGYFQPLYSGVFSGNKKFILVGIYSLFIPLYKIIAVFLAKIISNEDEQRLYIVLFSMVIGTIVTAIYGQMKSSRLTGDRENFQKKGSLYSKEDFSALFLNISLMFYMNIDLLVVRSYDRTESGLYSSVLLFGRIIYYFATTLGTILLPSVAEKNMTMKEKNRILTRTLFLMLFFALLCMVPINILKRKLILLLYGEAYLEAEKYVIFATIISLALSLLTIIINYVVGTGKTKNASIIMFLVDILLIGSFFVFDSVEMILIIVGMIGLLGTCIAFLVLKLEERNEKELEN